MATTMFSSVVRFLIIPLLYCAALDKTLHRCECHQGEDKKNEENKLMQGLRITGGEFAEAGEFPYQAGLVTDGGELFCGGAILDEVTVVTAFHCLMEKMDDTTDKRLKETIYVHVGSIDSKDGGNFSVVTKVILNDNFLEEISNNNKIVSDIALMRVDPPFEFDTYIQPIGLLTREAHPGEIGTVTGWGSKTGAGPTSSTLKKIYLPIIETEKCAEQMATMQNETPNNKTIVIDVSENLCAGWDDGGKDSCDGDSGGPLQIDGKLAGIVSFGIGCGKPKSPGIYTNIYKELEWLQGRWNNYPELDSS